MGQFRTVRAVALAGLLALAAPAAASAAPSQLKVNGASSPLGIDSAPRFSWEANVGRQSAYEVEVNKGATTVWSSGKVSSSDDLDIAYGGPARESGTKYSWRVRVWDSLGQASGWSAPGSFETGLLRLPDWGSAEWIGGRSVQDHDWTDMTLTSDFRIANAGTGVTVLFHAQPIGKTWGEGYQWQLRSVSGAARVASVTGLVAAEPISIDGEVRTIQTVGTQGANGTGLTPTEPLAAAHANGAAVRFNGTGISFTPARRRAGTPPPETTTTSARC